jgi:hypothetical protein
MLKADQAFSKFIRARDKVCQAQSFTQVACSGYLQCCHIHGRGEWAIRVDEDNAIAMCAAHHTYFTHHDSAWYGFIEENYPGRRDELWAKVRWHRESGQKLDWQSLATKWVERVRQQEANV